MHVSAAQALGVCIELINLAFVSSLLCCCLLRWERCHRGNGGQDPGASVAVYNPNEILAA